MRVCKNPNCAKEIPPYRKGGGGSNNQKYCNKQCRDDHYRSPGGVSDLALRKYRVKLHERWGEPGEGKLQCLECGRFYKFVSAHVAQTHKLSAYDYKLKHGLDNGKALLIPAIQHKKRLATLENGTIVNLKSEGSLANRFKKGDLALGTYERRQQTLQRLKQLHTHRKNYGQ